MLHFKRNQEARRTPRPRRADPRPPHPLRNSLAADSDSVSDGLKEPSTTIEEVQPEPTEEVQPRTISTRAPQVNTPRSRTPVPRSRDLDCPCARVRLDKNRLWPPIVPPDEETAEALFGPRVAESTCYSIHNTPDMRVLEAINSVRTHSHRELIKLWQVCTAKWARNPLHLISSTWGLAVDTGRGRHESGAMRSVIWPEDFCRYLSHILASPVWCGRPKWLAYALQMACICRVEGWHTVRPWAFPWNLDGECGMLKGIVNAVAQPQAPIRVEVMTIYEEFDEMVLSSWIAILLYCLAKRVRPAPQPVDPIGHDPMRTHHVTTQDLRNVCAAINQVAQLRFNGCDLVGSIETAMTQFDWETGTDTPLPRTAAEFRVLCKRAWIDGKVKPSRDPFDELDIAAHVVNIQDATEKL